MIISCALEPAKPGSKVNSYYAQDSEGNRKRFRRVSSVVDMFNKPGLPYWAASMATEYLSEALEPGKPYSAGQLSYHLSVAKEVHQDWKKTVAEMGTEAHEWIADYFRTGSMPCYDHLRPEVVNSLNLFAEVFSSHRLEVVEIEFCVWLDSLETAGTVDAVVYNHDTGAFEVWDWKTGNGVHLGQICQVAAYSRACIEMGLKGYPISGAVIGRIGRTDAKPDVYRVSKEELEAGFVMFEKLCSMYDDYTRISNKLRARNKKHKEDEVA